MKKMLLMGLAIFGFTMSKAQDDADKKFRFGLKLTPSINWLKIDDEKRFGKGGSVVKFGYGLMTEFRLAGPAWFSTGFQIDYEGGKVDYKPTSATLGSTTVSFLSNAGYYYNDNDGFLEVSKVGTTDSAGLARYDGYVLTNRTYKSTYLTIPLNLRLKTKEIGYITYYGNIGLLASIHLKTKANDQVYKNGSASISQSEDLNISDDMNFAKFGFNIGGGVEFNLSGSTSIIAGINWVQGFSNFVKNDSKYLIDIPKTYTSNSTIRTSLSQKFSTQAIALTVGVLF